MVNNKTRILDAALDLFSKHGYEATSISMISDLSGVNKSEILKIFENKKEILVCSIEDLLDYYENKYLSRVINPSNIDETMLTPENIEKYISMVAGHIDSIVKDEKLIKAKHIVNIEQYRNKEIADLLDEKNYLNIVCHYTKIFKFLIDRGKLKEYDPKTLAIVFTSPITVQLNRLERNIDLYDEAMEIIRESISLFVKTYVKESLKEINY